MSNSHFADPISEPLEEENPLKASFSELVEGDAAAVAELTEGLPSSSFKNTMRAGFRAIGRSVSENPKSYAAGGAVLAGLMGVGVWQLVLSSRKRR